jgi:hypothetical protein
MIRPVRPPPLLFHGNHHDATGQESERRMISENFDRRTFANMEVALERACAELSAGSESHRARRHIASRIIECAGNGNRALGALTAAGLAAAKELRVRRTRTTANHARAG